MKGKPVWVDWIDNDVIKGSYILIRKIDDICLYFVALDVAHVSYNGCVWKALINKTWRAYRKEQNERT